MSMTPFEIVDTLLVLLLWVVIGLFFYVGAP